MSVEISITDQIVEINETSTPVEISAIAGAALAPVWGNITGTLSNQTDLQNALNAKFDDPTGTTAQYLRGDGTLATFPTIPSGTVTSVGLTMPSAFSVANSPITSSGTLAVTGAGTASQYIRGDGQLANFPDNQGGGSSVNYYLNGSVTQGTFGGDTYYEMSKTPILGVGTNFTRTNAQGNGYIASFITDAGDPSLLNIPAGNWNVEFYFQANSNSGNPQFYAELYKVDASNNFTLVGTGSTNPEGITNGTTIDLYYTAIPVPQTSLLVTDRLAIRIFVITSGRTITLHTENSNLCEVITTLSTGLNALNGLTAQVQYFATGTSGTDFAISSATDTHTFNLPTASATNRGALSSADWTTFNNKENVLTFTTPLSRATNTISIPQATGSVSGFLSSTDWTTFNSKQNALTNPITGTGASGQIAYFTGSTSQVGNNNLFYDATNVRLGVGTNTPQSNIQINENKNGITNLQISNTTAGTTSQAGLRLDSDASSGTMNIGKYSSTSTSYLSIAATDGYLSNANFGDITLQNEVATGKIKFSAGAASTAQMTLTAAGRLLLGQTTEGTQRLQVTGDTLMVGSGNTGGTIALQVQNSDANLTFAVFNSGQTVFSPNSQRAILYAGDSLTGPNIGILTLSNQSNIVITNNRAVNQALTNGSLFVTRDGIETTTVGVTTLFIVGHKLADSFAPTSGAIPFTTAALSPRINQVGSTGITRGLYVNPTLTAAADWRSIEWSNNTGWGLYGVGTANNYLNGRLGLGSTTLTAINLNVDLNISGAVQSVAIQQNGIVQSGVTSAAFGIFNGARLQSTAFTLTNYYHYWTQQSTLSGGSAITNQYGYTVDSTLIGATNNYGFYGNIASGTNRWNIYMNGTALNYMNGALLLGSTTSSGEQLQVTGTAKITGNLAVDSDTLFVDAANNNVGIGTTTPNTLTPLHVNKSQNTLTSLFVTNNNAGNGAHAGIRAGLNPSNFAADYISVFIMGTGFGVTGLLKPKTGVLENFGTNLVISNYNDSEPISFTTGTSRVEKVRIFNNGNVLIQNAGAFTDTGERLQVTGTSKITGASSFGGNMTLTNNQNGITSLRITNTTAGTGSQAGLRLDSDASSGTINMGKYSSTSTAYLSILPTDGYLSNANFGDMTLQSEVATGRIKFAAGAASTPQMTLFSTGNLGIGGGLTDSGQRLQVTGTANITSKLSLGAGTTSNAQINLASSTAPTSPNNGDIWFDGTNLFMRIGGVTKTFTLI